MIGVAQHDVGTQTCTQAPSASNHFCNKGHIESIDDELVSSDRGICQSFEDSVDEDFVPEAFPSSDEDSDEERAEVDALDKIHGMRRDKEVDVLRGAAQTIAEKYRSTPNYATFEKPQYALVDVEQLGKLLFGRCPNCQLCGRRSNMSSNVIVSSIAP